MPDKYRNYFERRELRAPHPDAPGNGVPFETSEGTVRSFGLSHRCQNSCTRVDKFATAWTMFVFPHETSNLCKVFEETYDYYYYYITSFDDTRSFIN